MMEIPHLSRCRHKTRTVNHIRFPRQQRSEHGRIIVRVVFEVGVLHHHERLRRFLETADQRRPLALIDLLVQQPHPRLIAESLKLFPCRIARSVIHDDQLADFGAFQHPFHDLPDRVFLVIGGHDHSQATVALRRCSHPRPLFVPVEITFCPAPRSVWRRRASRRSPSRRSRCGTSLPERAPWFRPDWSPDPSARSDAFRS